MLKKLGLLFVCVSLQAGEKVQLVFGVHNCTTGWAWNSWKSQSEGDKGLYPLILKKPIVVGETEITSENAAFAVSHARNFGRILKKNPVTAGMRKSDFAVAASAGAAVAGVAKKSQVAGNATSLLAGLLSATATAAKRYSDRNNAVKLYTAAQEKYTVEDVRTDDYAKEVIYNVNSQVLEQAQSWIEYRKATSDLKSILSFADTQPDWISPVAGSLHMENLTMYNHPDNHWTNFREKRAEVVKVVHPTN